MHKSEVKRLKVSFQVNVGEKIVGTFATLRTANVAAKVAEEVATWLGRKDPVEISEVLADKEAA